MTYFGGKGAIASWIVSRLPAATNKQFYCEPFAGMAAVLMARPRVMAEMLNDIDNRIYELWKAIRDYPDELQRAVELTPWSRHELLTANQILPDDDLVERARKTYAMLQQSLMHSTRVRAKPSWAAQYLKQSYRMGFTDSVFERLHGVQLENRCALDVLERTAEVEDSVIYCDPPYEDVELAYSHNEFDRDRFADLVLAHKGKVAISGYGDEWDRLGWERDEKRTTSIIRQFEAAVGPRTEVLWRNYGSSDIAMPTLL